MKTRFYKSALFALLTFAPVAQNLAATHPVNLVVGVGPVSGSGNWAGFSAVNLIPGTSILPVASTTTTLYLEFVGGTQADISNMVLYKTTTRNNRTVASVTPVKLGGVSNPTIVLTDTSVCPVQPVSVTNPCIVRLDPVTLSLSSASDYWFVAYFSNDSNNMTLEAASNALPSPSLSGFFEGRDDTQLTVGQAVPATQNTGHSYFLVAVMSD
jgi:hypothetical protein